MNLLSHTAVHKWESPLAHSVNPPSRTVQILFYVSNEAYPHCQICQSDLRWLAYDDRRRASVVTTPEQIVLSIQTWTIAVRTIGRSQSDPGRFLHSLLPASSLKETSPSKAREINRRKGTNIERWYGREVVYSGRRRDGEHLIT